MKALFLILFFFSTFMLILGFSSRNSQNAALGNALIFGGFAIYIGIITTWILFKIKENGESKK